MARLVSVLGAALVLALAGTACGPIVKPMCALEKPHQAALRALLSEHRFEELEATLRGYQEAADRDHACEGRMWSAFSAPYAHPDLESRRYHLDLFVASFPESFVPYTLRGAWGFELGMRLRGGKFVSQTAREQIEAMHEEFREAVPHLLRAIELHPTAIFAHGNLLDLLRSGGSEQDLYAAYERGLVAIPASHLFRESMLAARAPKWGGSRAEQAALAFDAWTRRDENPRMWFVVGGMFVSLGDDWWWRNQRLATFFYSVALRCDDAASWYERRAKARRQLGDGDGAIADARAILEQLPRNEFAWLLIAGVLEERRDFAGAVRELDAAFEFLPDSLPLLARHAELSSKARKFEAAEADHQRLVALDRSARRLRAYGHFLLDTKRRDFDRAVALLREATELDPRDAETWALLGDAQFMVGDPGRVQSYERFLELVDTSTPENAEHARAVRAYLASGALPRRIGRRSPQEAAEIAARRAAAQRASAEGEAAGGR